MEKYTDPWPGIRRLIGREKEKALAEFRSREFKVAAPAIRRGNRSFGILVRHPAFMAAAASLLLAIGLALFLFLRGSWHTSPVAPGLDDLLAGSFLYGIHNYGETGAYTNDITIPAASIFTALATAGLERVIATAEPFDHTTPVEHGDPDEVRERIGKAIRENTLEQLLIEFRDIHDKEV